MASEVGADLFRLLPSATRSPDACTGAVDLLSRYGLSGVYATLCNKPIPDAIENSRFFRRVVGSTAIRRGDGMELMELVESPHLGSDANLIQTFPLEMLRRAFPLRENGPVQLPEEAKGVPTVCVSAADDGKDKKSKKHRHKDKEKHRHKDKEKRRHKDKEKGKEKGKVERSAGKDSGGMAGAEDHSKKHKKRKKHETDGAAGK